MRAWLWHHFDALRLTVARLARAPWATLLNAAVIGVALALPVGLYVAIANLQGVARSVSADPQLTVYLKLDAKPEEARRIEKRLRSHPAVQQVRFVSRAEALRDLEAGAGLAEVVSSLPENPLPDAFVVQPAAGEALRLDALGKELLGWPSVAEVRLDTAWARRLEAGIRLGRLATALLAGLFAFALVVVTFNTIRLQMLTRRDEIVVSRLIGATDAYIRRPFLYFGALQGLFGGAAAWALVWGGIQLLNGALADLARLYGTRWQLAHLTSEETLALIGFAALLGWAGSWLSVARQLAGLENAPPSH